MAENDKIVSKVVGRLTELRFELGAEERVVLDRLIMGDDAEVSGHSFEFGSPGRVTMEDGKYKLVE